MFIVYGLTGPGFEPKSTASVAVALSTRPLIDRWLIVKFQFYCLLVGCVNQKILYFNETHKELFISSIFNRKK